MKRMMKRIPKFMTTFLAAAVMVCLMPLSGVQVYATAGDPSMTLDAEILYKNVNTSNAQTLWYANKTWFVIGFDGIGAASVKNIATLLASGNLGQTKFDENGTSNV